MGGGIQHVAAHIQYARSPNWPQPLNAPPRLMRCLLTAGRILKNVSNVKNQEKSLQNERKKRTFFGIEDLRTSKNAVFERFL